MDPREIVDFDRLERRVSKEGGRLVALALLDEEALCGVDGRGWSPPLTEAGLVLMRRRGLVKSDKNHVQVQIALADWLEEPLRLEPAPPLYHDDDNSGHGWTRRLVFTDGDVAERHHERLGPARHEARHLSCIAACQEVSVFAADEGERVVCRYERKDNRWHDLDERVLAHERHHDELSWRYRALDEPKPA